MIDPAGPDIIFSGGMLNGAAVGALSGVGVGYVIGHFADRHTTVIHIVD